MSTRQTAIDCTEPDCNTRVATGQLINNLAVYEIQLDQSVAAAPALFHGMGIGEFSAATVVHTVNNGAVEHTITSKYA